MDNIFCKYIMLLLSVFILYSCTQPIILKNMAVDQPGYYMYGKIPQRSFWEDREVGKLVEKWNVETSGSQNNSSIVIYNNIVFVGDLSGRLYAYDRSTGKLLGYEKYGGSIDTAPVVYKLRLLFVVNEKLENYSTLVIFDFMNGKVLRNEKISGGVINELLKMDNGIIILTDRGELIKYDFLGNRIWSLKTNTASYNSPASDGEVVIVTNESGNLLIVSSEDGKILFKKKFEHSFTSGIIIENGCAYFADRTGMVFKLDISERKILWTYKTSSEIKSTSVLDGINLYVGNLSGVIYSINKITGELVWKSVTNGMVDTTPLITKNLLVQPDVNKKIFLINSSSGEIKDTLFFDHRTKLTPVLYDSLLFVGSDRGEIHAYKINGHN